MTPLASSINDKKLKNRGTDLDFYFMSIEGSYSHVEVALYCKKSTPETSSKKSLAKISSIAKNDVKASSHLIPYIDTILQENKLTINNLSFIAIDNGPGAFTSLRVCIATVNGIAFAYKIPLIGVNGLYALCQETVQSNSQVAQDSIIICLLNAFNNDVYYSINKIQENSTINTLEKNCKNISVLLEELTTKYTEQNIIFTGNGALLHQEIIAKNFGNNSLACPFYPVCSAQPIAEMALELWEKNQNPEDFPTELAPNYMKTQEFPIKK